MQPNHYLLGQVREPRAASRMTDGHQPRDNGQPQSSGAAPMRSEDSWIDVSSQPSSSSFSSAATNEDIITTGLQVEVGEAGAYQRRNRRRRLQHLAAITTAQVDYASRDASQASSSQEEYDESESESDRVLSSSNEDITRPALPSALSARSAQLSSGSDAASSDDEDDTSTALGMGISPSPFVPQPNIFTHPPATSEPGWPARRTQPSVSSTHRAAPRRDSYPSPRSSRRTQYQHSPYNMISPSHHTDHDAALRASLSTLLSCAAAARGLPKNDNRPSPTPAAPSGGAHPASFRLVGASVAMGEESSDEETTSSPQYPETSPSIAPQRNLRAPSVSSDPSVAKAKRRSSSPKDRGAASKKSRRLSMTDPTTTVSPTIMTWVISAGVVVLFSAISFSAGYMIGREVGRVEVGMMGDGVPGPRPSTGCGQEAVRGGLRKLRWGSAAAGSASLASM
ncbi:hypothetical protein N7517_004765 [Penicillium concentricum]|uniref:Uncharacterized protein n=1 Tax=Penicillium concentricum TaxID=293559 RepID=A0A9W9V9P5_9EURO|nr:uncharacterized protein N7517_004765 [Penicillium concentricum]KAJ5372759.1 hypothetical protein N7517_004765 [Penicillium concentricum]